MLLFLDKQSKNLFTLLSFFRGISIFDIKFASLTSFNIKFADLSKYDIGHLNSFETGDFDAFSQFREFHLSFPFSEHMKYPKYP